jgi:predicted DNA-binding transcriptional regulator AlpA
MLEVALALTPAIGYAAAVVHVFDAQGPLLVIVSPSVLPADERLVSAAEFALRLGLRRRRFGQLLADGQLPAPVKLPGRGRRLFWLSSVVAAYLRDLAGPSV